MSEKHLLRKKSQVTVYNGLMNTQIGVAILTNGSRLEYLQACINSFLNNCHYRPLVISVFDNGSTDGTAEWLRSRVGYYGIDLRFNSSDKDLGCAVGTNKCIDMVKDCEYVIHLESDFEHLPAYLSGEDRMWLHRAVSFMQSGECDYMYLRRMINERDIFMHWWSQWMGRIDKTTDRYLRCPNFWWSNNPTLFRTKALYDFGTLPLDESKDGTKGTPNWSKPELEARRPPNTWIHKWGLFVHELPLQGDIASMLGMSQCKGDVGASKCKYGFFKNGVDAFCTQCVQSLGYVDMYEHARRFASKAEMAPSRATMMPWLY
jgi:glycosyltransferase involved in cell wall biosynthesis